MHLYNNVWKEILNMIYQIGEKRRFVLLAFRLVQIWYGRYIQYPVSIINVYLFSIQSSHYIGIDIADRNWSLCSWSSGLSLAVCAVCLMIAKCNLHAWEPRTKRVTVRCNSIMPQHSALLPDMLGNRCLTMLGWIINCEAQARVRQGWARDGSQGERPQSLNPCLELTLKLVVTHPPPTTQSLILLN